jgi:outer membrane protein TolC
MTRYRSLRWFPAALATAALLCPGPAAAQQLTDDQIKALIKEAERFTDQSLLAPAIMQVEGQGPSVGLTLDDAVNFALERNLDIAVQRLNPQLSDIQVASARSFYQPVLTSMVSQVNNTNAPTSQLQLSSGGAGVTNRTVNYNAGLTQNLPWGGATVSATFNNSRQATNSNNAFYNPQFQSIWSGVFTQPLLRGLRTDAQRRQLLVSRVNRDISDVQLRASITNIVSNVRNAYWDYVFATMAVDVARQSLELATKLVQDNQVRVEVGTMAPIDVVQAQAEAAMRRQTLVNAESTKRTTELALKRLIVAGTDDPNWTGTIDATDRPAFTPEPVDLEAAVKRALGQRTDLEIAKKNLENNSTTLKYLRDQSLPDVDFQLNYGVQGVGGPYQERANTGILGSQVTNTVPGGLNDALGSLLGLNYPRWTAQINISYPLGLSSQDASVARARVQLSQVEAQLKQIQLQIATEVTNAVISVRNNSEAVQASQATRELAQRRLEAEQSKFDVGMSTNYFVVQAQRDLNDSRNAELRAILNYRKALVELERLQQTTLQNQNITVLQAGGGGGQ